MEGGGEDVFDDPAGVVAAPGAGMVLSARLEVHLLVFPTHGPVDLPGQFTVVILCKIMLPLMAAFADIMRFRAVIGKGCDLRGVPVAFRAVDGHGIVGFPLPLLGIPSTWRSGSAASSGAWTR